MAAYVDTSAWIALHEPRDRNHPTAKRTFLRLVDQDVPLVTGWHTVVELADGLARHYGQKVAAAEIDRLLASPRLRLEASEPHRPAALELFRGRGDWNVDLSDCLSFALMESLGLTRAFTYDKDFAKAGFERLG